MKKYILLLIIPFLSFGQDDYVPQSQRNYYVPPSQNTILGDYYNSKGHPKTKGLNFKIKKPLGFEQNEGARPNVVQTWKKIENNLDEMLMVVVMVENLPAEYRGYNKREWENFLKDDSGVEFFADDLGNLALNSYYFSIDQQPGIYYEGFMVQDRLDMTIKMYHMSAQIFYNDQMFTLQMISASKATLENQSKLFRLLANSVVFLNQYENY